MNENDYIFLERMSIILTCFLMLQFLLIVWVFDIQVSLPFFMFLVSLGIVGVFMALFIRYKRLKYLGEMKGYLKLRIEQKEDDTCRPGP